MSRRSWGITAAIIVAAVLVGVGVWALANSPAESQPTGSEASPAPSDGTLTPVAPTDMPDAACETTSTAAFQAMMAENGWISWETQHQQIGARPFDRFPDGAPPHQIVCRWGLSPDLATDNIEDLAWSPIGADAAAAAQDELEAEGFQRLTADDGVYLALTGAGDAADAEGYGETYLFTGDDVRWARTKADVAYVKAPDEQG